MGFSRFRAFGLLSATVIGLVAGSLAVIEPAGAVNNPAPLVAKGFTGSGSTPSIPVAGVAIANPDEDDNLGVSHGCAVTAETSSGVKCWGYGGGGQLGNGSTTAANPWIRSVALNTEAGTDPVARASQASGPTVASSMGGSCVIFDAAGITGGVQCWGQNGGGQIGDGTGTVRLRPAIVKSPAAGATPAGTGWLTDVVGIDAGGWDQGGYNSVCAVTATGAAYSWGFQDSGELGDGIAGSKAYPSAVSGLGSGVANVAVGNEHACAALVAGTASCWGENNFGEIGDSTLTVRTTPAQVKTATGVLAGVRAVDAGDHSSCALVGVGAKGAVYCWGRNDQGQLGKGDLVNSSVAVPVSGLAGAAGDPDVTSISVGGKTACAGIADGSIRCWGYNAYGQVGDGTTTSPRTSPVKVVAVGQPAGGTPLSGVSTQRYGAVSTGVNSTCARLSTGQLDCWGYSSSNGELAQGTSTSVATNMFITCGPMTVGAGQPTTCTATVTNTATDPVAPAGAVSFSGGGATNCTLVPVNASTARCTVTASGTANFTVGGTYTSTNGLATSSTGSDTVTVVSTVNPTSTTVTCAPNPLAFAATTTCTATVTDTAASGAYDTAGQVRFSASAVGGSTPTMSPTTCTVTGGSSTASSCAVSITGTTAGTSTITAAYSPSTLNETTKLHKASSGTSTVTWQVPNTAPTGTAGSRDVARGSSATFNLVATDGEGDPLTYATLSTASMPAGSTTSCTSAGSCTVTIAAGTAPGSYSFTWKANDGTVDSSTVTETVVVTNTAPLVNDVVVNGVQRGRPASEAAFILSGSDAEGDPLTYAVVDASTLPAGSTLTCSPAAACTIAVPADAPTGIYAVTYRANDGDQDSAPATVSIGVGNDAPVAGNVPAAGVLHTTVGAPLAIHLEGSDPNGDTLTYSAPETGPAKGTLTGSGADRTYTAAAGTTGSDSFTYAVSDNGPTTSAPGTVSIVIDNTAPVADAQTVTIPQGSTQAITLTGSDVNGDALTYAVQTAPGKGSLSCTPSGACTYSATPGASGDDEFTFVANDGTENSPAVTVSIHLVKITGTRLSIGSAQVVEPDGPDQGVFVPLTMSAPASSSVTVSYYAIDGTATVGSDYLAWGTLAKPRTITLAAGKTWTPISPPVKNDTLVEANESFRIRLVSATTSDGTSVPIVDADATVTIIDNHRASTDPVAHLQSATVTEGDGTGVKAQLVLQLTKAVTAPVSVTYTVTNGTATGATAAGPGKDYKGPLSGTIKLDPGDTSLLRVVDIPIWGDTEVEDNETVNLQVVVPAGAPLVQGDSTATITIRNDD